MEAMATHNTTLCEVLGQRIRSYKTDHPNLSGTQIAKKFNMSTSSLNRIENGDVRVPNIDQVLKVLRGTGATGDLLKYLDASYPIIAETYQKIYISKSSEFVDVGLEVYLNDKDKFIIILLAFTGNGTTRDEISSEFGKQGIKELEFLLDKGLLSEVDGKIGDNNKDLNLSYSTVKNLLSYSVENCFKVDDFSSKDNFIFYRAVKVNRKKASNKIIDILKAAETQIFELLSDPDLEGEDDLFYGMVTDSLVSRKKPFVMGGLQ